ncbi:MAG TPA: asparaginase [Vicinamibacterales bacterium]|nr:asparaginase [Vicinamibacterales bacterium]
MNAPPSSSSNTYRFWPLALLLAITPLAHPLLAQRAQGDLPRVHFVATGGTISNRDGGRLSAEELAKSIPGVDRYAQLTHEQFTNVASSELTLAQWVGLSKRINHLFATDKELDGIVVTSGTDTLEETAFFLHLTVRDPRPVIVVGSMRNPSTIGYEGAANLLEGVRVAAEPASRDKGVLVVLNDEINSARNVTKTDALRLQTFRSRELGLLGVVDRDRVVYFNQITQRHNERVEFDITKVTELPRVDVLMVYQGAPADLIKAAVDNGAKGIVMAVAGAGALSGNQSEGLNYAASKGVFIVTSTRTGSGRIAPPRAPGGGGGFQLSADQQRRRQFTIAGEDHIPIKARILLMLALTKTTDRNELQRIFSEY